MTAYSPTMVETIDGRQVLSDSPEWRACCEAVYVLNMPQDQRQPWLEKIGARRGESGRKALAEEISRIEPAYLLALGSKELRRAYLDQVEKNRGPLTRESLEQRLVALWEERKAATAA